MINKTFSDRNDGTLLGAEKRRTDADGVVPVLPSSRPLEGDTTIGTTTSKEGDHNAASTSSFSLGKSSSNTPPGSAWSSKRSFVDVLKSQQSLDAKDVSKRGLQGTTSSQS